MATLRCSQCEATIEVIETISSSAHYICKAHTKIPQDVFFQECQFDPDLTVSRKPLGTRHLRRQGSEVNPGSKDPFEEDPLDTL